VPITATEKMRPVAFERTIEKCTDAFIDLYAEPGHLTLRDSSHDRRADQLDRSRLPKAVALAVEVLLRSALRSQSSAPQQEELSPRATMAVVAEGGARRSMRAG